MKNSAGEGGDAAAVGDVFALSGDDAGLRPDLGGRCGAAAAAVASRSGDAKP